MAKPVWQGNHPVGQIGQTRPFYRFCATGLGAAMWFFVSTLNRSEKLDANQNLLVVLPDEERRPSASRLETSLGSLDSFPLRPLPRSTTLYIACIGQWRYQRARKYPEMKYVEHPQAIPKLELKSICVSDMHLYAFPKSMLSSQTNSG
jgi:hypothetical protein